MNLDPTFRTPKCSIRRLRFWGDLGHRVADLFEIANQGKTKYLYLVFSKIRLLPSRLNILLAIAKSGNLRLIALCAPLLVIAKKGKFFFLHITFCTTI